MSSYYVSLQQAAAELGQHEQTLMGWWKEHRFELYELRADGSYRNVRGSFYYQRGTDGLVLERPTLDRLRRELGINPPASPRSMAPQRKKPGRRSLYDKVAEFFKDRAIDLRTKREALETLNIRDRKTLDKHLHTLEAERKKSKN